MASVVLIVPNFLLREDFGEISDPPIGVASIAGHLERNGHQVAVIDAMAENLDEEQILSRLANINPQYIGISVNYSPLHNTAISLAKAIRESLGGDRLIITGGNHVTALRGHFLKEAAGSVDCVVMGEGETGALTLINAKESGAALRDIPGVAYLEEGRLVENPPPPLAPDIDSFGMPAYHLLPMERYKRYNIVSMRGCPYICSFCSSTTLFTRKVRYRSNQSVLGEIEYLLENYGHKMVWFSDDTFTVSRNRTMELMGEFERRRLDIAWSCLTSVNTVQPDLLAAMKRNGCRYISYGVESGNPEILKANVGKSIRVPDVITASKMTHAEGIEHYGFFILGFPGETWDTIYDSYALIDNCHMDGGAMNILIPLPGTKLWGRMTEEERLFSVEEMEWDQLFARLPDETRIPFAARLASRWCSLSEKELMLACAIGERMFGVSRHMKKYKQTVGRSDMAWQKEKLG